jgi:hypothetical protein
LRLFHPLVERASGHELVMAAALSDLSRFQHHDLVEVRQPRQVVGMSSSPRPR